MVSKPYKLNHPLYPHPLALKYFKEKGVDYEPFLGSYDLKYEKWYNNCRKDIHEGGATDRPIWHYVPAIYRVRDVTGERIYYKEIIQAHDQYQITHTFDHVVGLYQTPYIDTYYNYREQKPKQRLTGVIKDHYFIDYNPSKVLELAELAPDGQHQQYYLINQAQKKFTHTVFFTNKTFAFMDFDDLYEIARSPIVSDALRNKIKEINAIDEKQELKNKR